jgi:hypothetical protein
VRLERALLGLAFASSACATTTTRDYVTGALAINRYGLDEEIDLGVRESTLMLASVEALGLPIDADDAVTRSVHAIIERILAVPENRARMPPLPWEVHVVKDQTANAWTFAGGQILVMSGLFDSGFVQDEDEAAAVLGHEIAHAALRHATERRTLESLRGVLAPLGRFFGPRLVEILDPGGPRELMKALSRSASEYDRSQEIEADLVGLEMMARAGYRPERALSVWKRLASTGIEAGSDATHPSAELRLGEIDKHLPVARYLVTRRASPPPASGPQPASTATSTGSFAALTLPRWIRPPREVLDLEAHWVQSGAGRRASFTILASRDLFEDQLRYSLAAFVERDRRSGSDSPVPAVAGLSLARSEPLARARTELRVELPRLSPGRYVVRAKLILGALRCESAVRFTVPRPSRAVAPPR